MLINGFDVANLNAKQFAVEFSHAVIINDSAWDKGAAAPYFAPTYTGFRSFTVVLYVKGETRQEIIQNCSDIVAKLLGPVDLVLDGFSHYFRATLSGTPTRDERAQRQFHRLTLPFVGYEFGDEVEVEGTTELTIDNPGNMTSPCRIELTPTISTATLQLTGICRDPFTGADLPVTVNNLTTGKVVVIDGVTGLVTQDGAIKEVDAWELPSMLPGRNIITCDNQVVNVKVTTTPLYI